jgi:predicted O-methyltransferase YrrM
MWAGADLPVVFLLCLVQTAAQRDAFVKIIFPYDGAFVSSKPGARRPIIAETFAPEPFLKCTRLREVTFSDGPKQAKNVLWPKDNEDMQLVVGSSTGVCSTGDESEEAGQWGITVDSAALRCFVLQLRLVSLGNRSLTFAEDVVSFCAFPNPIKYGQGGGATAGLPLHIPLPQALDAVNKSRYVHMVHDAHLAEPKNYFATFRSDFLKPAGVEPYNLLATLAQQLKDNVIFDLGTHYGTSAFALASEVSNRIASYDVVSHENLVADYNKMSTEELRAAAPNVAFKGGNALFDLRELLEAPLISLDTAHFPDTMPFERELIQALQQAGYNGIVVCDDIFLNEVGHHGSHYPIRVTRFTLCAFAYFVSPDFKSTCATTGDAQMVVGGGPSARGQ